MGVNGNVLMVGSIPLADTGVVLGALSNNLDGHLPRYPDGESDHVGDNDEIFCKSEHLPRAE